MIKRYEIPLKLPSLNDYVRLCRGNKYAAAKVKADIEFKISLFLRKMPRYARPVVVHFLWVEENRRRDYDNIAFAKKFILDAMVKTGKLKNDNRKHVIGFTDNFDYGKKSKVIIAIEEVEDGRKKNNDR
jgi:Holliday junction resolvase RusA-like endonuclease